jgi:RPA family protein
MSESEQSGAGRREVAYRLFATEFDDADYSYSESDEERAPNYVITPTGARVNRLFVVGVLTEVEEVSEDVLRARVVDPTGAFVLYAGQYQPDEQAFLERAQPPMFVALTGKARTFQPDDSDQIFTSVRPESISEVDAETRDRWTVQTAEQTIGRVEHMATALSLAARGDDLRTTLEDNGVDDGLAAGIPLAIDHYGTTGSYLTALRDLSIDAARLVAGDIDEVEGLSLSPSDGDDADVQALADSTVDASVSAPAVADTAESPDATPDTTAESEMTDTAETATPDATETQHSGADTDEVSTVESSTAEAGDTGPTTETAETRTESTETTESGGTDTETEAVETETAPATESAETDSVEAPTAAAGGGETGGTESTTTQDDDSQTADGPAADPVDETAPADAEDDIGDFEPGEFDLDEDEREEIEAEYGTEFQSGTDVPDPGEADIDTPDPEELAEEAPEQDTETAEPTDTETASPAADELETTETASAATEPETTPDEDTDEQATTEDVDLEDATLEVMGELDEGTGADRETLVAEVADRYDADPADVEDAIQDALMGGRCYEPDDATVKPI